MKAAIETANAAAIAIPASPIRRMACPRPGGLVSAIWARMKAKAKAERQNSVVAGGVAARRAIKPALLQATVAPTMHSTPSRYCLSIAEERPQGRGGAAIDRRAGRATVLDADPGPGKPSVGTPRAFRQSAPTGAELDHYGHMVRGLVLGAGGALGDRRDQPLGQVRRQQRVVDAQAHVALPGAGLVVPERVQRAGRVQRAHGVSQPQPQ